jgi:hypothetical protein
MIDEYVYVTGQDGELYEVRPTDALLSFLQRLAEGETEKEEQETSEEYLPAWSQEY